MIRYIIESCSIGVEAFLTASLVLVAVSWLLVTWSYARWAVTHRAALAHLAMGRLPCAITWTAAAVTSMSAFYALGRPLKGCFEYSIWEHHVGIAWVIQIAMVVAALMMLPPYWQALGRPTKRWASLVVLVLLVIYAFIVWALW